MPNPKVEWKRIGSPVIYEAVCPECEGKGEMIIVNVGGTDGAASFCGTCANVVYPFPSKKGHIYETRYE